MVKQENQPNALESILSGWIRTDGKTDVENGKLPTGAKGGAPMIKITRFGKRYNKLPQKVASHLCPTCHQTKPTTKEHWYASETNELHLHRCRDCVDLAIDDQEKIIQKQVEELGTKKIKHYFDGTRIV